MSAPTFAQESINAVQGAWRLLLGRRDSPQYFLTDQRALISSFIAILVVHGIDVVLAGLLRAETAEGGGVVGLLLFVVLYGVMAAASWMVLSMIGKRDKFIALLTVDNWVSAVFSVILTIFLLLGLMSFPTLAIMAIAGLVARVNNARFVGQMRAREVTAWIIAQILALLVVMTVIGAALLPATPQ